MSQLCGQKAEQQAHDYLCRQGLDVLTRNYHCRWGEIDLIMKEADYLVFIEVRARKSSVFGSAIDSINYHKQQKIIKTALYYMTINKLQKKYTARFDVVSIQGIMTQIEWVKNAFGHGF